MIGNALLRAVLVASAVVLAAGLSPASAGAAQDSPPVKGAGGQEASAAAGLLGSQMRVSLPTTPECDRYHPAVAYNRTNREYLVVWHNTWPDGHRDVYARRVTEQGVLKSWFAVSAGPHDRAQPAVAFNSDRNEYLVVWMHNANGDGSTYEIWGRRVAHDGAWMGPEFQIITWPNRTFWSPRVAYNYYEDRYLVVWSAHDATTLVATDVAYALLDGDGMKFFHTILSDANEPHQPDVAYISFGYNHFMVVWRRLWTPSDGDIMGARIGPDGALWDPPGVFAVNTATEDQTSPAVTSNGWNRFMVVWQHAYPGPCCDWDVRAQEYDYLGNPVGGVFYVAGTSDDETDPRIVGDYSAGPSGYLAVWQRSTATGEAVWARAWGDIGWQFSGEVASGIAWHYELPDVAVGGIGAFITYEGDSGSNPMVYRHIYGRRWVPHAISLPLVDRSR